MKQVKVINYKDFFSSQELEEVLGELLNTGWEIHACTSTYILLVLENKPEPTTFKERLQVEERELNIRLTKLTQFLDKTYLTKDTKLNPKQLELMVAQQQHMEHYLQILRERMKLLHVPTV